MGLLLNSESLLPVYLRLFTSLGLLITAILLSLVLVPLGLLSSLIQCIRLWSWTKAVNYVENILLSVAISIDLMGNVACKDFFNQTMLKRGGHPFGSNYETISKVLGINKSRETLTDFGRALANLLNFVDHNHVEKATL